MAAFALTLAVAAAGSWLGRRLRLPAGILLGAILAVAALQLATQAACAPAPLKIFSQGLVGAQIGAALTRSGLSRLRRLWPAALALLLALLGYNLLCAVLLGRFAGLSAVTAICALAPCGITDMSLLCGELGGNTAVVAAVQTLRLFCVLALTPLLAARSLGRTASASPPPGHPRAPRLGRAAALTLALGLGAAAVGYLLRIPAGCLSLSMAAVAVYQLATGRARFPAPLRKAAQCTGGMLVGSYVVGGALQALAGALVPLVLGVLGFVALNQLLARWFSRSGRMSYATALFATAPGGMSDMGLLAAEFGGDLVTVAFFQQLRYVGVILLYPPVIRLLGALL